MLCLSPQSIQSLKSQDGAFQKQALTLQRLHFERGTDKVIVFTYQYTHEPQNEHDCEKSGHRNMRQNPLEEENITKKGKESEIAQKGRSKQGKG